jgi:hypothetical protein
MDDSYATLTVPRRQPSPRHADRRDAYEVQRRCHGWR